MNPCQLHSLPYRADPAHYFAAVRRAPGAVLLDAGRPQAERGRFDLLSAWPLQRYSPADGETAEAFLQRLREGLAQLGQAQLPAGNELPFAGGLIGYLSYDFGRRIEQLPSQAVDDLGLAQASFGLYAWALISDHQQQTSQLLFHPSLAAAERQRLVQLFEAPETTPGNGFRLQQPFRADLSEDAYRQAIARIQAYIQAGDCYQVNFAQRFQASCSGDAWGAYLALRQAC
ncbi:MAG TPA: chorismate-binding protein, partial [Pseudomonas sp.]|nr:chorismate-binding protein [Pseudomonas sp.]